MLRRFSRAHRSHAHTLRPASVDADQVAGTALGATAPQVAQTAFCSGITRRTYRATVGTPLSITDRAARAQATHVQMRPPAASMARDHANGARSAEAGRPQTAQQVLDVMSMTVVRHRDGLATDR